MADAEPAAGTLLGTTPFPARQCQDCSADNACKVGGGLADAS